MPPSRFVHYYLPLLIVLLLALSASAQWKEKVLYSFQGIPDGAYPGGGVVFDKSGNLYGATTYGGANDCPGVGECGTVYQLQPPLEKGKRWREKTLYIFKGANHNDGSSPSGGVLIDSAGNLYGTNAYGGTGKCQLFGSRTGCGTIYQLIPPKQKNGAWTEKVLYSFQGGKDGQFAWGDLTFDSAGNIYGATQYGGGFGSCNDPFYKNCGTVFRLSPPKTKGGRWTEKVLYAFKSGTDGANPNGGLVFDKKGAIYGTTFYGGDTICSAAGGVGCGTAFELKPPVQKGAQWTEKQLHSFANYQTDGAGPNGDLVFDSKGGLCGTTNGGGSGQWGVVFRLAKMNGQWSEIVVHAFQGNDGASPMAGLVAYPQGSLYGTASGGGDAGDGTLFQVNGLDITANGSFALLYSFAAPPDGAFPLGRLAFDKNAHVYGATQLGGTGAGCGFGRCGTVFELSP